MTITTKLILLTSIIGFCCPPAMARAQRPDIAHSKANLDWQPVASRRPCTARLTGRGNDPRAICFDLVFTGWRAPPMVVVPGLHGGRSFAIGKYEISVSDYSKYCVLTNNCKPVLDRKKFNYPQTGISLADAQQYVNWLSIRTGHKYRLPTPEEWQYAVSAPGTNLPAVPFCSITKDNNKVDNRHGIANGWGLVNTTGNVQEWTVEPSGKVFAMGGDYKIKDQKCGVTTAFKNSGKADKVTGFRVVREIN